jgi:hypothetical protein
MDSLTLIHQGVLYLHVVAFAIAFSAVVREDLALLRARCVDLRRLQATARTLTLALAALWVSGLALMAFDGWLDLARLAASSKPLAKLLVASAVTANGLALHAWAFPILRAQESGASGASGSSGGATLPVVLGATSSVSWSYAAFLGVGRVIAPSMSFSGFMTCYALSLVAAVAAALLFVRPRVERWLAQGR